MEEGRAQRRIDHGEKKNKLEVDLLCSSTREKKKPGLSYAAASEEGEKGEEKGTEVEKKKLLFSGGVEPLLFVTGRKRGGDARETCPVLLVGWPAERKRTDLPPSTFHNGGKKGGVKRSQVSGADAQLVMRGKGDPHVFR